MQEKYRDSYGLLCESAAGCVKLAELAKEALEDENFYEAFYIFRTLTAQAERLQKSADFFATHDINVDIYGEQRLQEMYDEIKADDNTYAGSNQYL